jgi:general secretion pathway protein D
MQSKRYVPGAFLRLLLAGVLLVGQGCQSAEVRPGPIPAPKVLVDTYPVPVDPAVIATREPIEVPDPLIVLAGEKSTLVYYCRYARSEILREAVEGLLSPEGTIQATARLNTIIISDAKDAVPGLLQLLQSLDQPVPQVLVEARIVEVTLDSDLEFELRYLYTHPEGSPGSFIQPGSISLGTPGADPNPTQGILINARVWSNKQSGQLDAFIRFLLSRGNAKLLSSPNLIVAAGEEASLITGEEVPVQSATVVSGSVSTTTLFKRVGIKLRVIPLQVTGDTATVEINPEVSAVTGFTSPGTTGVSNPIIAIRNVSTTLSLKDGEILTIGGLLKTEDRDMLRKIPGAGDVPGLGELFKSRRSTSVKTQLIFFLRVNILDEGQPRGLVVHRPGIGLERLDTEIERTTPLPRELDPLRIPPKGTEPVGPTGAEPVAPKTTETVAPKAVQPAPPRIKPPAAPRIIDMTPPKAPDPAATKSADPAATKSTAPKATDTAAPKVPDPAATKSTAPKATDTAAPKAPDPAVTKSS